MEVYGEAAKVLGGVGPDGLCILQGDDETISEMHLEVLKACGECLNVTLRSRKHAYSFWVKDVAPVALREVRGVVLISQVCVGCGLVRELEGRAEHDVFRDNS